MHMGHSSWCEAFLSSMFPARWLSLLLLERLVSLGIIAQGSDPWRWFIELSIPLSLNVTIAQYYLMGLAFDRLKGRLR